MLAQEPLSKFWPDATLLLYQHWLALCVDTNRLPMDLDKERYGKLEELGALYVLTARRAKKLVGYLFSFVLPHFHYKSSGEMAAVDMYWVAREERRGTGLKLFLRWEEDMRKRGIVQMIASTKRHDDHTKLFELLGWKHTDNTLVKFL